MERVEIHKMIQSMNKDSLIRYLRVYMQVNRDKSEFLENFCDYVEKAKTGNDGYKYISVRAFHLYLLGLQGIKIDPK